MKKLICILLAVALFIPTFVLAEETEKPILIKKITAAEKSVTLPCNTYYEPIFTISPENATNQQIDWESSNKDVIRIAGDDRFITRGPGKSTLTGRAVDGSKKTVKITVTVPEIYVTHSSITITTPDSVKFGYQINENGIYSIATKGDCVIFRDCADENGLEMYELIPQKAGTASFIIQRLGKTVKTVKVTVKKSAIEQ